MILYLNLEKDRIEAILKRPDPQNPFQSYCEEIEVPDNFNISVDYTNENGEPRKREMTVTELKNTLTYKEKRWYEYPELGDQLDDIWHLMDQEIIPGKGSEWYNKILAIKQKYPKPE